MGEERRSLRFPFALAIAVVGVLVATPALAGSGGASKGDLNAAQRALAQAKAAQAQADSAATQAATQLTVAKAALTQAQAQLTAIKQRITTLDAEVVTDESRLQQVDAEIAHDKAELATFVRASYESGGSLAAVSFMVDAQSIGEFVTRLEEVAHTATSANQLIVQVAGEEHQAQATLTAAVTARQEAQAAQEQARTEEVIVANDEVTAQLLAAQKQATAYQAHLLVANDQHSLASIKKELAAEAAAAAAAAAARAKGTVYPPIPGATFTVDTNLLLPSGENAQTINAFLAGTALAGLGGSYMDAETTYGVSALYLTAHSIEESGWGTSALAQLKHNLFGFGADDANPFGDAMSFPSFSACILYVAHYVKVNYLLPTGQYYHGPTLRGMNVDYASDPLWAEKIAAIADTIPLPPRA